jgi:lipopolysaccharide biosynthesis glycosyltransferase
MSVEASYGHRRLCLATVVTDGFVPGALVMLHSFLAHHPWFTGDIVLIHAELSDEYRELFVRLSDRVVFVPVSDRLKARVGLVTEAFPEFTPKQARFYSLEAFRLTDYDTVLFCDSDLLFRKPITALFELNEALIACGDGFYYQGRPREWISLPEPPHAASAGRVSYHDTFNAGLMVIDRSLVAARHYDALLNLIDSRLYEPSTTKLADQMVLNIHFAGEQRLVGATYNYVLGHRAKIYKREGLSLHDAHVLHFNGDIKPWIAAQVLWASQRDPAITKGYEFWFASYVSCLQALWLQQGRTQSLKAMP